MSRSKDASVVAVDDGTKIGVRDLKNRVFCISAVLVDDVDSVVVLSLNLDPVLFVE